MWRILALLLEIIIFLSNLRKLACSAEMREWAGYRTVVALEVATKTGIAEFKHV